MEKPRVFIGSSSEALAVAQAIHANLEHQCFCEIWTHGVFGINKLPLESLLSVASHTDYAIIVFHPDDFVTTRGKRKNTPRDNVIFELGLFIGRLGKDRTCFVQPRGIDIKIPSDLVGLIPAAYDPSHPNLRASLGPACVEINAAISLSEARKYGVLKIGFFEEYKDRFESLLKTSSELTSFFIHSRRWREMHDQDIRSFLDRDSTKLSVFLPNVANKDMFDQIKQNFSDGPQIKHFVIDAYRYFFDLKQTWKKVKIYDFDVYPTYSFYKFDQTCVLAMYPTCPNKQSVPTLEVSVRESFGLFVGNDLKLLLKNRKPKTDTDLQNIINSVT